MKLTKRYWNNSNQKYLVMYDKDGNIENVREFTRHSEKKEE